MDLHPHATQVPAERGGSEKEGAPPPDERGFPRKGAPGLAGPRRSPMTGRSRQFVAAVAERGRDETPQVDLEIAAAAATGRRVGRREGGGGGGDPRRIGEFQRGFAGFGTGSGERFGVGGIWSAGFRTGFFLPRQFLCLRWVSEFREEGGACVWWCTCLSRPGGRETLSKLWLSAPLASFSSPLTVSPLSPSSLRVRRRLLVSGGPFHLGLSLRLSIFCRH